jgi:hypothetical protein
MARQLVGVAGGRTRGRTAPLRWPRPSVPVVATLLLLLFLALLGVALMGRERGARERFVAADAAMSSVSASAFAQLQGALSRMLTANAAAGSGAVVMASPSVVDEVMLRPPEVASGARYVRLVSDSVGCMEVAALEVYGPEAGAAAAAAAAAVDLALNRPVSASSQLFGWPPPNPPAYLVDGRADTWASTGCGEAPWMEVDLGRTPRAVARVRVLPRSDSGARPERMLRVRVEVLSADRDVLHQSRAFDRSAAVAAYEVLTTAPMALLHPASKAQLAVADDGFGDGALALPVGGAAGRDDARLRLVALPHPEDGTLSSALAGTVAKRGAAPFVMLAAVEGRGAAVGPRYLRGGAGSGRPPRLVEAEEATSAGGDDMAWLLVRPKVYAGVEAASQSAAARRAAGRYFLFCASGGYLSYDARRGELTLVNDSSAIAWVVANAADAVFAADAPQPPPPPPPTWIDDPEQPGMLLSAAPDARTGEACAAFCDATATCEGWAFLSADAAGTGAGCKLLRRRPPAVHCRYHWTECPQCGRDATQQLVVDQPAEWGGNPCPTVVKRSCNLGECKQNCVFGDYGPCGSYDSGGSCGNGWKKKRIVTEAKYGGACDVEATKVRCYTDCPPQPAPQVYTVTATTYTAPQITTRSTYAPPASTYTPQASTAVSSSCDARACCGTIKDWKARGWAYNTSAFHTCNGCGPAVSNPNVPAVCKPPQGCDGGACCGTIQDWKARNWAYDTSAFHTCNSCGQTVSNPLEPAFCGLLGA